MSAAIVVVLVVATEAHRPSTGAMITAARALIGPQSTVLVQEVDAIPTDVAADELGVSLHADAIVEVRWSEPDHLHARLHVLELPAHRWTNRDLDFQPADDEAERGRALGLTLGSMVPSIHVEPAPVEHPSAAASAPNARAVNVATAAIAASSGIGGTAGGVGVDAGFERSISSAIALRGGAIFRSGDLSAASASASTLALGAGLVGDVYETPSSRPIVLSLRLDALLVHQSFTRTAFGEIPTAHGRWLPGADLLVTATWYPIPSVGFSIASGTEIVFGTTRVFVDQDHVATIPRARWIFEAGACVRF